MSEKVPFMVFSGMNSRYLAEKTCASLDRPLGNTNITHFADDELAVSYEEPTRGAYIFLIQSIFPNPDNLMELPPMIGAAKRAPVKSVVAVAPHFGWARQDRKNKPRVSIGAKLVADLLSVVGIDRLITMDSHVDQIQGFFNISVDYLYVSAVSPPYIQPLQLENPVIAIPDIEGSKRASTSPKYLGVPLVLCNKSREKANEAASIQIIDDVGGKNVVLIDDIVDIAGTIIKAANIMLDAGVKFVRAIASHCVMSDPVSFRVQESVLTEMVFTDSIPYAKRCLKVEQLSTVDMFAETIKRVMNNESISSQYII